MSINNQKNPVNPIFDKEKIHVLKRLLHFKKSRSPSSQTDLLKTLINPYTGKPLTRQGLNKMFLNEDFSYLDKEIDPLLEEIKEIENKILSLVDRKRGNLSKKPKQQ